MYLYIYKYLIIKLMINIRPLLLISILISSALSMRQSQLGVNDWSLQNIGKLTQLTYNIPPAQQIKDSSHSRNLFYQTQLGLFGHLNKATGGILSRESLGEDQKIIESDDKELIVVSANNQIVRYSKSSMHRVVDNRLMGKEFTQIKSYIKTSTKVYIANQKTIKQFHSSIKNPQQISSIQIPDNIVLLKLLRVSGSDTISALTYNHQSTQICIHPIQQSKLGQKSCQKAVLSPTNTYVKVYQKTGYVYLGDQSRHYHFSINDSKFSLRQFNSKPVSYASAGVRLLNGMVFLGQFSGEKVYEIEVNRNEKVFVGEIQLGYLNIYELVQGAKSTNKHISIQLKQNQQKIYKIWMNILSQSESQVVVQFEDLQLAMFNSIGGKFKQVWHRQQSLAYIDKVLFMKYEGYADHLNNPYHIKMDDPQYDKLSFIDKLKQVPTNFLFRLKCQVEDIYNFFIEKFQGFLQLIKNPDQLKEAFNFQHYIKATMSETSEKKYGLRKYVIVITKYNTMFSIDTKTSNIIWKKKYGNQMKLVTLIKLKQQYEKQIAIAINYKYHITYITQIHEDGSMTDLQQYQTFCEPTVHKISAHSVLLRADDKVHRYDINKQLLGEEKEYSFFSVDEANRLVIGWKVIKDELIKTWAIDFPVKENIIKTSAAYRGQPQANLPLVNDKKVLFKNIDFSNIAVLTLQQYNQQTNQGVKIAHRLHLYIINGLTGTVQFSQYQTGVNYKLPVSMVYDEHNVIVTYYNTRNRVYEIWSIEAFQIPEESQLLSKKYEPNYQKEDITFRSKVYGTVLPIKNIFTSQSKQALLKRNLIIITRQNKIYLLPREFISTRRPKTADADQNANSGQAQFVISKYPPQEYILPLNTLGYLNHNKNMNNLDYIRFSSSDLQSTIFMMAYGTDIFLIRAAPDRAFDMLADGFNYLQLVLIMTAVTIAAVFIQGKVKQTKLKKPHLQ